jgi:hypothetical protein
MFDTVHFGKGEVECQGRFGPLIFVDTVAVQTIAAAACAKVVERQPEVVATQKPLEGPFGLA